MKQNQIELQKKHKGSKKPIARWLLGISRMFLPLHHCIIIVVVAIQPIRNVRSEDISCSFLLFNMLLFVFLDSLNLSIQTKTAKTRKEENKWNVRRFAIWNPVGIGICEREQTFHFDG